ncbi:MAG: phosphopyruvate hydratase [Bacilli bacterium]
MNIKNIKAREILDSRGNPTVEVDVILDNNIIGRTSIPSGASTGINEACELRDNDSRYLGLGVRKAVNNVNTIIRKALIGMDASKQREIDTLLINLDNTSNKSNLGANAILGVSISCLKASALSNNQGLYEYVGKEYSMPICMMNILNGGMHADNNLDFQEFMIIPFNDDFNERIRIGSEVFHCLKKLLKSKGLNTNVGDEGGFAPNLSSNKEALNCIVEAIKLANYIPGKDVFIGLDVAATSFYNQDTKLYKINNQDFTMLELLDFYKELVANYPIISIEDPFYEEDFQGFSLITKEIGDKVQIVGDDLFTTNKVLLQKGIELKACNAILIKPNQIGTYSEMLETINLARLNNYKTIISHRSGETEDTFIADLAVGLNLGQIKTGSMSRTDRISKYNRLIRIEENVDLSEFL